MDKMIIIKQCSSRGNETHSTFIYNIFLFNIIILINPKYLHNTKTYNMTLINVLSPLCSFNVSLIFHISLHERTECLS